jgi:hypothetical protein
MGSLGWAREGRRCMTQRAGRALGETRQHDDRDFDRFLAHWALAASAHWCRNAPFSMRSAAWSLCSGNLIGHICPRPTVNARASSGKLPQHARVRVRTARRCTCGYTASCVATRVHCTNDHSFEGNESHPSAAQACCAQSAVHCRHSGTLSKHCYGPLVLCAAAQAVEHGIDEGFDLARVQHRLRQRRCAGLPGVDIATSGAAMHVALRPAFCALQTTRWTLRALITGAARSADRCMTQGTMHDAAAHVLGRGSPQPTESRVEDHSQRSDH